MAKKLCKAEVVNINEILRNKGVPMGRNRHHSDSACAVASLEAASAVTARANDTLIGLAVFLDYFEYPQSAEQVRNVGAILQQIIYTEQQRNAGQEMIHAVAL